MERRAGHETVIPVQNRNEALPQLPHATAFEYNDKTPKAQLSTILVFNAMRERLLLLGEMEQK